MKKLSVLQDEINQQGYTNEEIDRISDKDVDILILSEDEKKINFYGESR